METRQQTIFRLRNCGETEADRINDRLQQCNVRVRKENGETELSFSIRTRLQAAKALSDNPSISAVEYQFNGKWVNV